MNPNVECVIKWRRLVSDDLHDCMAVVNQIIMIKLCVTNIIFHALESVSNEILESLIFLTFSLVDLPDFCYLSKISWCFFFSSVHLFYYMWS